MTSFVGTSILLFLGGLDAFAREHSIPITPGCKVRVEVPQGWASGRNVLWYYPSGKPAIQARFDPDGAEVEIVGHPQGVEKLENTALSELSQFGGGTGTIRLGVGYPRISGNQPRMTIEYQETGIFSAIRSRSVFLRVCGATLSIRLRYYIKGSSKLEHWEVIQDAIVQSIRDLSERPER